LKIRCPRCGASKDYLSRDGGWWRCLLCGYRWKNLGKATARREALDQDEEAEEAFEDT